MRISVLRMPNSTGSWGLVVKYLELRKAVFIDQLKWQLHDYNNFEHEQYDALPMAHYVLAHEEGRVIAGARLLRCDIELGGRFEGEKVFSYMIRDAVLGRIDLPKELMSEIPPTDAKTWELTRLVSASKDPSVTVDVLSAATGYIRLLGGENCLCLGSPVIMRLAKRYGFNPMPVGPICSNENGRFLAFNCPV